MNKIIENFIKITKIPHCSYAADGLRRFIVDWAREYGYRTEVDLAGNILAYRGEARLCLQAHYDMVCMGRAPAIDTYIEDGWLMAKESSLGADNGMAIAMMMELMRTGVELEFLFTADEEVGLVGAGALEFPLSSSYMLNLDFEDEAEVCIGCAGGADISARRSQMLLEGTGECYEISIRGLCGGHSGVDIDKGIPSAIKLLGSYFKTNDITQIASLYAGERANSIPANAVAIIRHTGKLEENEQIKIRKLKESPKVLAYSLDLIGLIDSFEHGVRQMNEELSLPHTSINLAIISTDERGGVQIESSARAMSMESLEELVNDTEQIFTRYGFDTTVKDKYPAWKPEINSFTDMVGRCTEDIFGKSKTMAIHAGLECGVILEKYPHIQFASIGPTIKYPHSTREKVDIKSVDRCYQVVQKIVQEMTLDRS